VVVNDAFAWLAEVALLGVHPFDRRSCAAAGFRVPSEELLQQLYEASIGGARSDRSVQRNKIRDAQPSQCALLQ
jgi:hypothetical protein